MPVRGQTLMRTRCPECDTVFRVTSEQLRLKAGKVRCGNCQAVFNAFDQLQEVEEMAEVVPGPVSAAPRPELPASPPHPSVPLPPTPAERQPMPAEAPVAQARTLVEASPAAVKPAPPLLEPDFQCPLEPPTDSVAAVSATEPPPVASPPSVEALGETAEESTQAARAAGLVAARELSETATFNRWAAGTLASDGSSGFSSEPARRMVWPFALAAALLGATLIAQLLYHYRTEAVLRLPAMAGLYAAAGVDVPLPHDPTLVSIESSDLQSDNARGLFVLQATLKNRANYRQALPVLELTLTDTNDQVVSRRVMPAADYLPPGVSAEYFPANGEIAIRLWIEARNTGAAGYRLYIFYP